MRLTARLLKQHAAGGWSVSPLRSPSPSLEAAPARRLPAHLGAAAQAAKTAYFRSTSAAVLAQCVRGSAEAWRAGAMEVVGLNMEWPGGSARSRRIRRPATTCSFFSWQHDRQLRSSAGEAFLVGIRQVLQPGDHLFLSADLVSRGGCPAQRLRRHRRRHRGVQQKRPVPHQPRARRQLRGRRLP